MTAAAPTSPFVLDLGAPEVTAAVAGLAAARPASLAIDPATVERDLGRLVLSLVEMLRQLMEAQAIRRMEAGHLTPDEEEMLGLTLMRARERIVELAAAFGLGPADLRIDLGPLGRLV